MIRGLHHASVTTADAERLCDFYEGLLGFSRVLATEWDGDNPLADRIFGIANTAVRMVMLRSGPLFLEVFEFHRPREERTQSRAVSLPGITHTAVISDDIDADYARLTASGVRFRSPPQDAPGLCRAAYCEDPDGNLVELLQPVAGGPFDPGT